MRLDAWQTMGQRVPLDGNEVFVVDTPARSNPSVRSDTPAPPLLVIHGFPTSSVDWAPALDALSAHRRVVLFDLPGFGLSAKPDRPYGIGSAADAAQALIGHLGLAEFDLVTHDMGDTVGGELLARQLEGTLVVDGSPVTIRRRVVTNGSIYLSMAALTDGQRMLWEAPDEALPVELAPTAELLELSLRATLAPQGGPGSNPDPADLRAAADSVCHSDGSRLLPRLIRYLSDRRDNEARYTGAIESHPSPLGIVWGELDPIVVLAMARQLADRRPDASLEVLGGVGHYPMIEAPDSFAAAVLRAL